MKRAQAELPKLFLSSGPLKDLVVWHGFAIENAREMIQETTLFTVNDVIL
jgi:hypothetical protein